MRGLLIISISVSPTRIYRCSGSIYSTVPVIFYIGQQAYRFCGILVNPEMAVLLTSLAKGLQGRKAQIKTAKGCCRTEN
jgi:hypothetical protein